MKNIVIAYIFILFELNVPMGEKTIELIPTWIGYFFLVRGFKELEEKSESFKKSITLLEGMFVVAAAMWFMNIFSLDVLGRVQELLEFMLLLFYYYSTYTVVKGIAEIEGYHQLDIGAKKVKIAWWAFFAVKMLAIISRIDILSFLILSIVEIIVGVYNLLVLNKIRKEYLKLPQGGTKNSLKAKAMIRHE